MMAPSSAPHANGEMADRAALAQRIEGEAAWRRIYIAGACDAGKTYLTRSLVRLLLAHSGVACVDCDPGQGSVGPPGVIGMQAWREGAREGEEPIQQRLRFIGSISPARAVPRMLAGMHALARAADDSGAGRILFDSSGYVSGPGAEEFQHAAVEILGPELVVWISQETSLPPLAGVLAHGIAHLEVVRRSPQAVGRTPRERREARSERLALAFREAARRRFECHRVALFRPAPAQDVAGRLVGFCDAEGFVLGLGIAESFDQSHSVLVARAQAVDPALVTSVRFGELALDSSGREIPR